MEILVVNGWTVRHDRAATAAYHRTLAQGDADRCGCSFCRNFALQRATAFPPEFLALLERLGVDAAKEHEVYEIGPAGHGLRLYSGWFCFIGGFTEPESGTGSAIGDRRFSFGFTDSFPRPAGSPHEAIAAVDFAMRLPWLLPDEDPG